jgi:outer membrane biosynthesis protein TonB
LTAPRDKELPIAIAGSLLVHVLLFLLLAALFANPTKWDFKAAEVTAKAPEKQVTLIFPDQLIPPPPVPKPPVPPPKKEIYMRTTQNEAAGEKPKNAAFISDRNTKASATKAPDPTATSPVPTTEGLKFQMNELANRDYRDGDIMEDAAKKAAAVPKTPNTPPKPQTAATQPTPPSPPKPPEPTPKPPTPPQPEPQSIASAASTSPLAKMMEEADKDLARVDLNRLPIEVRKPTPQMKEPDAPPPTPDKPQMREVADSPPVPKAIPVSDEVAKTTSKPQDKAFMPFTRTSENKGTISNRGTEDAVDAEGSPKGKYIRAVTSQVEKKWHLYRALRRDMVSPGSLKVEFYVNSKGKVENLRIVNDRESTTLLSEFTVRAIRDAEIPPMPREVMDMLPIMDKQRLKIEYNVLIY